MSDGDTLETLAQRLLPSLQRVGGGSAPSAFHAAFLALVYSLEAREP